MWVYLEFFSAFLGLIPILYFNSGSGTALDAQTRGLSTALIEKGDFGNETSSRSTKLSKFP